MSASAPPRRGPGGFTLVEVLVALVVMATIAALAWRGVDGMLRAREGTQASIERTTRLNTVIVQWEQDLSAVFDTGGVVPAIAFDGQTLRLTRVVSVDGVDSGVQMVAWALRSGVWTRWASVPVTKSAELQDHWLTSQQLLGNERGQVRLLDGVEEWQVYFYRGGRRTNAQSTGDVAQFASPAPSPTSPTAGGEATPGAAAAPQGAAPTATSPRQRELLPDGVQLVVRLNGHTLTRDFAVVPRS